MTAVSLNHAAPTRVENVLLHIADMLTAYVAQRREARADRRAHEMTQLRDAHGRPADPRALDIALLSLGSRPR